MKTLDELITTDDPGISRIREWTAEAENECEILSPSENRDDILLNLQVSTRSTLGAIAYETGGILVDGGWLRFLGSGNPRLTRDLVSWNPDQTAGFVLVADDAAGGFFAINGGALGPDVKSIYYWAPDNLEWEPLEIGYTDFFTWSLTSQLAQFYQDLRWDSWHHDMADLHGDQCFSFYPFLWAEGEPINERHRAPVPVREAWDLKVDLAEQMGQ